MGYDEFFHDDDGHRRDGENRVFFARGNGSVAPKHQCFLAEALARAAACSLPLKRGGSGWGSDVSSILDARRDPHPVCYANRPPLFKGRYALRQVAIQSNAKMR
jgi:hypothetical protein